MEAALEPRRPSETDRALVVAGAPHGMIVKMPWVYILRCRDDSLYTGAAKDLERRLGQHERGRASAYTRSRRPVELAYRAEVETWSDALKEEHRIKKLARLQKLELIASAPIS